MLEKKTASNRDTSQASFLEVNPFDNVDTSDDAAFREAVLSESLKKKVAEILKPVYFEYDSYRLTDDAIVQLSKVIQFLREENGLRIIIQGNCDERGSSEYNIGLGEQRAKVIREYLAAYGIKTIRLETVSLGREMPAQRGCMDERCHSLNRRSEFKILAK
ncbi:MAG TPA: OmpA family protein [Chitinispirillaceae bacterium]|nr:OmpA family protein [Chitinispirillaceae bacterium]